MIRRQSVFEILAAAVLTALCLFFWAPKKAPARSLLASTPVADWTALSSTGHRTGRLNAPIQIVVFSDFQCPFCQQLDENLVTVQRESPDVAVLFRHFPLVSSHAFAMPAAVAAECAGAQGRFDAMRMALFTDQKLLGTQSWTEFALAAGVPDARKFNVCLRDPSVKQVIERDIAAGTALKIVGTPAVFINGRQLNRPPTLDELRAVGARPRAEIP